MIAGLLLTFGLDCFLNISHQQKEGEIFTPYAIHRLEGIDGMVKWWDVVTKIMASKLEADPAGYLVHPREPAMVMAMNPMIRSIQILPEKGEPVVFTAEDTKKMDFSRFLEGPLKQAAERARTEHRLVLMDSLDLGLPYKMMAFLRPVYRHDENGNESFWGYIILAVEQRQVMSTAIISNLGKQQLDFSLYHRYGWEDTPHLVKERGMTEQGNPHAERIIAGDLWTIVLRPQGSGVNWMLLFFATLAGLSLTILISFLFRRNGILKKANGALKRSGGLYEGPCRPESDGASSGYR